MERKHIEAEVKKHLKVMPDVHPEILAEYRARLIEMNRDVSDPALMRRPGISWIPRIPYELQRLAGKLPKKVWDMVRGVTGRGVDAYQYSVLKAMYEVERGDVLRR